VAAGSQAPQLLVMLLCCLAVTVPQWLYWKCASGEFFPARALGIHEFHFKRPHVLQGLFSFRHGWLVHAPIMTFSIAGFFFLRGYLRMYRWAVPVFFIVYIYILFSWWCWWHGASFGQRVLIDIYPLLAIPFGAFVYKLRRLGGAYKHVLYGTIILLLTLNIWRTYHTVPPAGGEGTCMETYVPGSSQGALK
jgi:hypothetical protein